MQSAAPSNDLLEPREAAAYVHLTPKTLTNWRIQRKPIPYLKVGGKVLYRRSDLDQWLASCVVKAD